MRFRLAVVPYLNCVPLFHTLAAANEVDVIERAPADLAALLESGEADVALLPVFEYARGVGESLVPGVSIASDGPVRSVMLFLRKPIEEVRSVAVDRASRSSIALLQVLLRERHGLSPNISRRRADLDSMLASFDAALIIGDEALRALRHVDPGITALDLGELWTRMTRLPFVYAAWTTRPGLSAEEQVSLTRLLQRGRDEGYAALKAIARDQAGRGALSEDEVITYLTENIKTDFNAEYCLGAEEYIRLCVKHGLLPAQRALRFAAG